MDPALRFIVDIQNSEKVTQLTAEIGKQAFAVQGLNAQLQKGAISQQQFTAAALPMANAARQAADQIKSMTHAAGMSGQGFMQLGYAVDDIQYGFSAIVNNIPQIVTGLGMGAGVGGAAAIAAVAVNQLYKHWGELAALWGDDSNTKLPKVKEGLDGLAESIKEIQKAITDLKGVGDHGADLWEIITGSGIEGQKKLEDLKQLLKETKEALKIANDLDASGPEGTAEAKAVGSAVRKAIASLPGGSDTLMDVLTANGMSPDAAGKAISGAMRGNSGHLADINAITGRLGNQFSGLTGATPEAMKKAEKAKEDIKAMDAERKAEKEIEDTKKKTADALKKRIADDIDAKRDARVADLQGKQQAIMDRKHGIAEDAWKAQHAKHPGQILQGAKAVVDMYQKAGSGNSAREIAEKAHRLQEAANKELKEINDQLKKERAIRPR